MLTAVAVVAFTLVALILVSPILVLPCLVSVPGLFIVTRWYLKRAHAGYLRRAATEPPPAPARSEIFRQLGNSEAYSLQVDAAGRHLREAVTLATTRRQRSLSGFSLGRFYESRGRPVDAIAALRSALTELPDDDAPGLRVRLEAELAGYARVVIAEREQTVAYLVRLTSRSARIERG